MIDYEYIKQTSFIDELEKISGVQKPITKMIWAAGAKPRINYDIKVGTPVGKWAPKSSSLSSISGVSKSRHSQL